MSHYLGFVRELECNLLQHVNDGHLQFLKGQPHGNTVSGPGTKWQKVVRVPVLLILW